MSRKMRLYSIVLLGLILSTSSAIAQLNNDIRIIIRGDDIGCAHAVNLACIKSYKHGIMQSVEMMAPTAWMNEAVTLLNENTGLDVGIHLTLTSEWDRVKWGPVSHAPSLVDENGYFHLTTRQRAGSPPNTGFLDANPILSEVERELRAQIEMGVRRVPHISHLSTHMGTSVATPELKAIVDKLSREYGLPWQVPGAERLPFRFVKTDSPQAKEAAFVEMLKTLQPGLWLFVEHPGLDTPEMEAMGHEGYMNVGEDRAGVTHVFTSDKVQQVISDRGIQLVSYRDVLEK
jgi:chitin disaccharide deacetylase